MDQYNESDSLQHYGVKGMRWGVRRASKRLSNATTDEERLKAVSSLQKHRSKGSAELAKLKKKTPKLEANAERAATKYDVKAAQVSRKVGRAKMRAGSRLISQSARIRRMQKVMRLEGRAQTLEAKAAEARAKIQANKTMQEAFQREIKNIDQILVERGKKYLRGA